MKFLLTIFLFFASTASSALLYEEKSFKCSIGGGEFSKNIPISSHQVGIRTDDKPFGMLEAPWPLPVCPENGFVMYKDKFTNEEIENIKPYIFSSEYQEYRSSKETDHFLLAKMFEYQKKSIHRIADTYLEASWEAEGGPNYKRYLKLALGAFKLSLKQSDLHIKIKWNSQYMIVELNRLLGNFDEAEKELFKLKALNKTDRYRQHRQQFEQELIQEKNSNAWLLPDGDY
jgi:hypothetical protein